MQAAKQIKLSKNCLRCARVVSSLRSLIESIHFAQNAALVRIDGMVSTAANARWRSTGSTPARSAAGSC